MAKTRPTKSRAQKKKKEKPGADMKGRSKHRSAPTAHGSVYVAAPVIGKERELWRKRGDDNAWHSTHPCKGAKKDSRVHRYARAIGYEQSSEAVREEGANEAIGAARVDAEANDQNKSHGERVSKMGLFECFALEHGQGCDFYQFLLAVDEQLAEFESNGVQPREKLVFVRPSDGLLLCFAKVMRGNPDGSSPVVGVPGRGHKYGYIKSLLGAVNATTIEFHPNPQTKASAKLRQSFKHWCAEDDEISAPAFDMEQDMKKCFTSMMASATFSDDDKVKWWALLLLSIVFMGRASCMTEYMPDISAISLPPPGLYDPDGLTPWLEVTWTHWKARLECNVGKPYRIRVHRNYLDSRFCPVMWLLMWLERSKLTEGPIFGPMSTQTYRDNMNHILRVFMGIKGASSHSIRRAAAQWAGRCGDLGIGCRNAGRWRSWTHFMTYIGQGATKNNEYPPGQDPIFTTWVFKAITTAGLNSDDSMQSL